MPGGIASDVGVTLAALCAMSVFIGVMLSIWSERDQRKVTNAVLMFFVALSFGAASLLPGLHLFDTATFTARAFADMATSGVFTFNGPH